MPLDNSIPQNTEGTEVMMLAITPRSASNVLVIDVVVNSHGGTNTNIVAGLFRDTTAGALAASWGNMYGTQVGQTCFRHYVTAGGTSAITFKVRAGGSGAGVYFNGLLGGVAASSITITEYEV